MHNKNIWETKYKLFDCREDPKPPLSSLLLWFNYLIFYYSQYTSFFCSLFTSVLFVGEMKVFPFILDFLLQCPTKQSVTAYTWEAQRSITLSI